MATLTGRVRAPELRGAGGWINTDVPLSLAELRELRLGDAGSGTLRVDVAAATCDQDVCRVRRETREIALEVLETARHDR